ncbi:hypothetical protein [Pyrococcus yayanosii]|uniref:Uncharacterized protein n=1 Tax=Pyrococcus yayanosii (strain CH1 / JCM 16557) TaxID=529709 RepID=F8AIE0_PYRYC|nr:hypothetical protein [Pyrococcus yayanosii]AEH25543.1 hypothetical protein PYCH_18880 [Pyrococcus yayanosii CH1]
MKRILIFFLLLFLIPAVSAQYAVFDVEGEIWVLAGDLHEGSVLLKNDLSVNFDYVIIRKHSILDSEGKEVEGIYVTFRRTRFGAWGTGEAKELEYIAFAEADVPPGTYTVSLTLWGFVGGKIYVIKANIPLVVSDKSLVFHEATSYIEERPFSDVALNGESIVVYSHVTNLKSSNVTLRAKAYLVGFQGVVLKEERVLSLEPGDNLIRFELRIPYDLPAGEYELVYELRYEKGEYRYSKKYWVEFGVSVEGFSVESTSTFEGEENVGYVTVISERTIKVNVTVEVYGEDGSNVWSERKEYLLVEGPNMIKVSLPTSSPGKNTVKVEVSYGNVNLGSATGWYTVIAYPRIENVEFDEKGPQLIVTVENRNNAEVAALLSYRLSWENGRIYKETEEVRIPPGESLLVIPLPKEPGNVTYELSLDALGKTIEVKGTIEITPETPTPTPTKSETETRSKVPGTNTTVTETVEGEKGGYEYLILLAFVILAAIVVLLMGRGGRGKKRRQRPRPKRSSPLGRFKPPKPPKSVERRELPRRR